MISKSTDDGFQAFTEKMQAEGIADIAINNFHSHFQQLRAGHSGVIAESDIQPVESLVDAEQLDSNLCEVGESALPATVMIKLNGGLGTSMGLNRAKSLIPVKQAYSFLDLIIHHAEKMGVQLLFMNSFNTRDDTLAVIESHGRTASSGLPVDFLQHRVPKISQQDLAPVKYAEDPQLEWCPPGHGDIYIAMQSSGVLDQLLASGYRYALISNSDNLGASLDTALLGFMVEQNIPFLMEVTDRTEADKKGGHLALAKDGGLLLRESAQCAEQDRASFEDTRRHRYFNTNNLWLDLGKLKETLEKQNNVMPLPLICNSKTVNPRDPGSEAVYQLETAMGSAISIIPGAQAIRVPRSRFAPVKTSSDLLLVQSDLFELTEDFSIRAKLPAARMPLVRLDPAYYRLIDDFQARFPNGAPSLEACLGLELSGDILFGSQVRLQGKVQLRNNSNSQVVIEDRAVLEGEMSWD